MLPDYIGRRILAGLAGIAARGLSERGASSGRIRDDDFVPNGTVRTVWAKVRLFSVLWHLLNIGNARCL
jgi:hypothetical protein